MKEATPRFKPSQKMKRRYLLFEYKQGAGFEGVKNSLFAIGLKPLKLVEFDSATGKGIVRCERGISAKLRKALEEHGFTPIKTSGTLKALRR